MDICIVNGCFVLEIKIILKPTKMLHLSHDVSDVTIHYAAVTVVKFIQSGIFGSLQIVCTATLSKFTNKIFFIFILFFNVQWMRRLVKHGCSVIAEIISTTCVYLCNDHSDEGKHFMWNLLFC